MTNISISLDEEMIQLLEEVLQKDKTKRSRSAIISESLQNYILTHFPSLLRKRKSDLGPSIVSQLKSRKKAMKGPSFRFRRNFNSNLEPWTEIE